MCGCVRQSGSSKAVDQGNLEASQRLSTVFGVIYVVTYLDQYPAYMFEHVYASREAYIALRPVSLSLAPSHYLLFSIYLCVSVFLSLPLSSGCPSSRPPVANIYTTVAVRTTCLISEANSVVSRYRMVSTHGSSSAPSFSAGRRRIALSCRPRARSVHGRFEGYSLSLSLSAIYFARPTSRRSLIPVIPD